MMRIRALLLAGLIAFVPLADAAAQSRGRDRDRDEDRREQPRSYPGQGLRDAPRNDGPRANPGEVARRVQAGRPGRMLGVQERGGEGDCHKEVIFKDGDTGKLRQEAANFARWESLMPGLAPHLEAFREGEKTSSMLIELLPGQTIQDLSLSGDLKLLAMVNTERSPYAPNTPTLMEQGINATYDYAYSVLVAKGTPEPIKKALADAFKKAINDPKIVETLRAQCITPYFKDAAEATKLWNDLATSWGSLAVKFGLQDKKD